MVNQMYLFLRELSVEMNNQFLNIIFFLLLDIIIRVSELDEKS